MDNINQPSSQGESLELMVTDEETKKREEIANDFNVLISRVNVLFNNISTLRKKKIKPYSKESEKLNVSVHTTLFLLNEDEDQEFHQNMSELNRCLGVGNSILDSYIKFTKSSPDFEKFLNIIWFFIENYGVHRMSDFFQANAEKDIYLYPYYSVDIVLKKMEFLFNRMCGTLSVGARWTVIQPPVSHSPMGGDYYGGGEPYRPYGDMYNPYRYQPESQKPKYRDIGDSYEGQ